jgi:SAM-dependent methyltransferase
MTRLLNLGCGTRLHAGWTNVDFVARAPGVLAHDLRSGVPFPPETFDAVYHSHVLEHFPRTAARAFLSECRRVLRAGGVLRVVVPDLEEIARTYLAALERAASGDEGWAANYDYVLLELYDQAVRDRPGGEMGDYWRREEIPNLAFVEERGGVEARDAISAARASIEAARAAPSGDGDAGSRTLAGLPRRAYRRLRREGFGREPLLRLILGADYDSLAVGRFRRRGEPHLWMYDRYSLVRLLTELGFRDAHATAAAESLVPGWADFNLDTEPDGTAYKPYSLYVEARK